MGEIPGHARSIIYTARLNLKITEIELESEDIGRLFTVYSQSIKLSKT